MANIPYCCALSSAMNSCKIWMFLVVSDSSFYVSYQFSIPLLKENIICAIRHFGSFRPSRWNWQVFNNLISLKVIWFLSSDFTVKENKVTWELIWANTRGILREPVQEHLVFSLKLFALGYLHPAEHEFVLALSFSYLMPESELN